MIGRSEMDVYRHRQNSIVVRRVHADRAVAVIEVVSPANKTTADALESFVRNANDTLEHGVHLLIIDLFRPGRPDPRGIHAAIWDRIQARSDPAVPGKSLTLVAYESDIHTRAYVEPIAVGDVLPEMPLFLEPGRYVEIPLEDTYRSAWDSFPRRWRAVLESPR